MHTINEKNKIKKIIESIYGKYKDDVFHIDNISINDKLKSIAIEVAMFATNGYYIEDIMSMLDESHEIDDIIVKLYKQMINMVMQYEKHENIFDKDIQNVNINKSDIPISYICILTLSKCINDILMLNKDNNDRAKTYCEYIYQDIENIKLKKDYNYKTYDEVCNDILEVLCKYYICINKSDKIYSISDWNNCKRIELFRNKGNKIIKMLVRLGINKEDVDNYQLYDILDEEDIMKIKQKVICLEDDTDNESKEIDVRELIFEDDNITLFLLKENYYICRLIDAICPISYGMGKEYKQEILDIIDKIVNIEIVKSTNINGKNVDVAIIHYKDNELLKILMAKIRYMLEIEGQYNRHKYIKSGSNGNMSEQDTKYLSLYKNNKSIKKLYEHFKWTINNVIIPILKTQDKNIVKYFEEHIKKNKLNIVYVMDNNTKTQRKRVLSSKEVLHLIESFDGKDIIEDAIYVCSVIGKEITTMNFMCALLEDIKESFIINKTTKIRSLLSRYTFSKQNINKEIPEYLAPVCKKYNEKIKELIFEDKEKFEKYEKVYETLIKDEDFIKLVKQSNDIYKLCDSIAKNINLLYKCIMDGEKPVDCLNKAIAIENIMDIGIL